MPSQLVNGTFMSLKALSLHLRRDLMFQPQCSFWQPQAGLAIGAWKCPVGSTPVDAMA